MSKTGTFRQPSACKPSRLSMAEVVGPEAASSSYPIFADGNHSWQGQHQNQQLAQQQHTDADAELMPERCTSPVPQIPVPMHLPPYISRLDAPLAGQRHITAGSCGSTVSGQQIIDEAMSTIPGMHSMQQMHHQMQYQSFPAGGMCTSPGASSSCLQEDDVLMDFWVLLQQTQHNLQDMLVDLETAKIELELAKGRAEEAEHASNALRVQLAASQQCNQVLEHQLQAAHAKEAAAAAKAAALTQRNTELATEAHQAQQAAASMELKLERLQGQLATMQRNNAAAAAAAAATATAACAPAAAAAQEAAVAAAGAIATQLKCELSQIKSELAATQSRAARAELELAVARTKALVAQQEAAAAADRCKKLERQVTSLNTQLGAAAAEATVAAEDKQKLQADLEALQLQLDAKEARLRGSMNAIARASSNLRASYSAQGGAIDSTFRASQSSVSQVAAELRRSAQMTAGLLQKAQDLRASQQQQQQRSPREQTAPSYLDRIAAGCSSSTINSSTSSCGAVNNISATREHELGQQQQQGKAQVEAPDHPVPNQPRQQPVQPGVASVTCNPLLSERPASPFAAFSCAQQEQQQQQEDEETAGTSTQNSWEHRKGQQPLVTSESGHKRLTSQAASRSTTSQGGGIAAADRQSPIFKQRRSTAGGTAPAHSNSSGGGSGASSSGSMPTAQQRRHSRSSSGGGSTLSTGGVSPRCGLIAGAAAAVIGKAAALPPRPPRSSSTSSTNTPRSPRGSNPGLSNALSSGSCCTTHPACGSGLLSSASSSSPLLGSPCASRRTSSCTEGGTECSTPQLHSLGDDATQQEQVQGDAWSTGRCTDSGAGCGIPSSSPLEMDAATRIRTLCEQPVDHEGGHCDGDARIGAAALCDGGSAPGLRKAATAAKQAAAVQYSSDNLKHGALPAGRAAAWTPSAAGGSEGHRDSHTGDDLEAAGLTAMAAAGAGDAGDALLLCRKPQLLCGVSGCSVEEGSASRQLSTAGVSGLVAATSMCLGPAGESQSVPETATSVCLGPAGESQSVPETADGVVGAELSSNYASSNDSGCMGHMVTQVLPVALDAALGAQRIRGASSGDTSSSSSSLGVVGMEETEDPPGADIKAACGTPAWCRDRAMSAISSSSIPMLRHHSTVSAGKPKLHVVLAALLPMGVSAAGALLGGLGLLQHHRARKQAAAVQQLQAAVTVPAHDLQLRQQWQQPSTA